MKYLYQSSILTQNLYAVLQDHTYFIEVKLFHGIIYVSGIYKYKLAIMFTIF